MFLFHWCMNAIRCRRDTTLETMPLSPTKYNGLPPALDCGLQQQFFDEYSYDVTVIGRSLLDEDGPVDSPGFFQDRQNTVCPRALDDGQESAVALSSCQSESCDSDDVTAGGYFRNHSWDEPMTSRLLSSLTTDYVTANEINGCCGSDCETAVVRDVHENTEQVTYVSDISNESVSSFTGFRMVSSQLPQPHFSLELQRGAKSTDKQNSLVINDNLTSNTRDADDVDFSSRNSSRSTDVYLFDKSQRNAVASFPVDTFQDPLVTLAMFLVNSAVNAAVRILVDDVKQKSELNLVNETGLVPTANVSTSIQPLPFSDESTEASEDPVKAAASTLVNQVLSEIVKKSSRPVFECAEALPGETLIAPASCAAQSHHPTAPCSDCDSESKLTADNHVESGATDNAGGVLMPAVAEDYLSESSATGCFPVDEVEVLAAHELVYMPKCDCNSLYALDNDFESMTSLSGGRLTFASDDWRQFSPPFTDTYSSDCASEVLNNNNVAVGLLNDVVDGRCQCVSDDLSPYDHLRRVEDGAHARMMCSETTAERDVDLSGNSDDDDATKNSIHYGASDDDNYPDIRQTLKQFAPENRTVPHDRVAETRSSCESSCRPEDYFFHRYVIPVEQLEAGETALMIDSDLTNEAMAAQKERDQERTKMQLHLNTDESNDGTNIDADIEAVAAFCRAMFTPVETDADDMVYKMSPFDVVSSPETPDAEERCKRGVRRCISLRTSPGTPHTKKSVRFADALGLDLEYVRQIQTVDEPQLTIIAGDDGGRLRRPLLAEASAAWHRPRTPVRRFLCACFQAPGGHPDFMERLRRSRVVLESCEADDRALTITGVIRVANVTYHKTVAARVTTDGWATQTDVSAEYVPRSNDGTTDRFSFRVVLPHGATDLGRRVEFAVYYIALFDFDNRSETYWDNNFGTNYCFECYAHDDSGTVSLDTEIDNNDNQFSAWLRFA